MADFRDLLRRLEVAGELHTIEAEVDWNLEAAAIATMSCRIGGPALHFKKVRGCPPGYSLACNLFAGSKRTPWKRAAIAMGLDPEVSFEAFKQEFKQRFSHRIKPVIVSTGPCKEEIHIGKEVNIFELPLPYCHDGDGGRYGGTCHAVITKDPDSDWINWGQYRWMAHTKNRLGGSFQVGQQMANMYYQKYEKRGIPMPFCIALGGPPTMILVATLPIPVGESEADWVGGLEQEPVELVRAETNNLLVPANAEVIIEGEVRPHERWDEGPFGEYDGFMNAPRMPRPVYRIHAITHRKDPIYPFIQEGVKVNDSQCLYNATFPTLVEMGAIFAGFDLGAVGVPGEGLLPTIATAVHRPGHVREVACFFYSIGIAAWFDKLIVVDPYVNPIDAEEVLEEIVLKMHPRKGYRVSDIIAPIAQVAAYASDEEKKGGYDSSAIFDATSPYSPDGRLRELLSLENLCSRETLEWLREKWGAYGFQEALEFKRKGNASPLASRPSPISKEESYYHVGEIRRAGQTTS